MPNDVQQTTRGGMVKLYKPRDGDFYLAAAAISAVTPAGVSQAWHGVRANVQTFDKRWYEVAETPEEVARRVQKASSNG